MKKLLFFVLLILFSVFFLTSPVFAQEIVTRGDLNFDEGLSDQSQNTYGYIDSICIVRIENVESISFSDGDEWMKGLYYYMITHLNFLDVPFHYVVSWQGDVYEGRGGEYEVNPLATFDVEKDYSNPLLIAYFDNERGLTNQGDDTLTDIVSKAATTFSIEMQDIFIGDLSFSISQESQPSVINITTAADGYLVNWVSNFKKEYKTGDGLGLDLSGEIIEVTYEGSAKSWETFSVVVTAENTGDFPWYNSGSRATYLATSDPRGHASVIYFPDEWSSFSRIVTPTEEIVMPGEVATFEFSGRAPILPDTYTEQYELIRLPASWIVDTALSISISVSEGSYQLVEIRETGTGVLTVRECGHPSCDQISAVDVGYATILKEEKVGWCNIVYDGVNEGWVFCEYVKKL